MAQLFTSANLCRLLMRPSGDCGKAYTMYQSKATRMSEFSHGVVGVTST